MASEAFGNVEKAMEAAREAELAAYIMRDVELRQQNAQERGVLAYGKKPIPRAVPNQRFLQSTLKNVDFANRSAREREMWQQWDAQKEKPGQEQPQFHKEKRKKARKERKRKRSQADYDSRDEENQDEEAKSESSQDEVEQMLAQKPARGRGNTGSRADETGPFLFPTDEQEREEYEMMRYMRKQAAGPECPSWIRGQNAAEDDPVSSSDHERKQADPSTTRVKLKKGDKPKKKAKSLKKEHKKKRRKERSTSV